MIISKALLMPLLGYYYLKTHDFSLTRFRKIILFAMIFSWFGDISLEFDKYISFFFLSGLICFLSALLLYTIALINPFQRNNIMRSKPLLIIPFLFYGIIVMWILYPDLGKMALPVIIYASVLIFLVITAMNRNHNVSRKSFRLVLFGTISFTLSNTVIAIVKFSYQFYIANLIIMILYILGQYLIIEGCISQEFESK